MDSRFDFLLTGLRSGCRARRCSCNFVWLCLSGFKLRHEVVLSMGYNPTVYRRLFEARSREALALVGRSFHRSNQLSGAAILHQEKRVEGATVQSRRRLLSPGGDRINQPSCAGHGHVEHRVRDAIEPAQCWSGNSEASGENAIVNVGQEGDNQAGDNAQA